MPCGGLGLRVLEKPLKPLESELFIVLANDIENSIDLVIPYFIRFIAVVFNGAARDCNFSLVRWGLTRLMRPAMCDKFDPNRGFLNRVKGLSRKLFSLSLASQPSSSHCPIFCTRQLVEMRFFESSLNGILYENRMAKIQHIHYFINARSYVNPYFIPLAFWLIQTWTIASHSSLEQLLISSCSDYEIKMAGFCSHLT